MIKKPTLILLGILIILAAFAWWTQKNPSVLKGDVTATPTTEANPLADWNFENTRMIKYENPAGQPLTLRMGKDFNNWSIDQSSDTPADAGKVIQMLSELRSMQPVAKLESSTDENAMGLGSQAKTITLVDANGTTIEIKLGSATATGSGSYIKVGGRFYIVNTPVLDTVTGLLTMEGIVLSSETPTLDPGTPQP